MLGGRFFLSLSVSPQNLIAACYLGRLTLVSISNLVSQLGIWLPELRFFKLVACKQ